eukprot:TRINITY_DN3150_c0_g1_i1.p1 TRINITY_DN3150_c0_g1~~TRINITY_DN3150_c0_g1_i1.p1  ORF type:complete len:732 (-),score=127.15 TRINITY_DN3150_c0_g1_i1:942-3137(-)
MSGATPPRPNADEATQEKNAGNDAYQRGELDKALDHFTRAIQLNPEDYTFYSNRCMTFMRLEKFDEALADANRVIILNPVWPKGFYRKGLAHMRRFEFLEAYGAYSQGLQLDPESEPLKLALQETEQMINEHALLKIRETFIVVQPLKTTSPPPACSSHTSTLIGSTMIVLGGSSGSKRSHTMYTFNIETLVWTQPVVNGVRPNACLGHSATHIPASKQVIVFGGWDDNLQPRSDVFILDAAAYSWTKPETKGTPPPRRAWHTAVLAESLSGVLVFGGRGVSDHCFNDVHLLELDTLTWKQLHTTGSPPAPRGGHSCCVIGNNLIVWGGYGGDTFFNDMSMLSLESMSWQKVATFGDPPCPRAGHTASILPDNRLLIFGGDNGRQRFSDVFIFDPQTSAWQPPAVGGRLPSARCVHSACVHGTKLFIFGGADLSRVYNDLYSLDLDQLAQYEINIQELTMEKKAIGKGATAAVYKGDYGKEKVAVKKFHPAMVEEELLESFRKETCMMCELKHPNVLRFIGICTHPPNLLLVTEWAEYGSLHDLLMDRSMRLTYLQRLRMAEGAARGMEYLHDREIVHRDFKSLNLLVSEDFTVKVADFGLARFVNRHASMTQEIGTPHWTAPEVLTRQHYSEKADVYSYGITMWELLTRSEPYGRENPALVASKVVQHGVRPEVPPDTPVTYERLMRRCWHTDPDVRPSFTQIIGELICMQEMEMVFDAAWDKISSTRQK